MPPSSKEEVVAVSKAEWTSEQDLALEKASGQSSYIQPEVSWSYGEPNEGGTPIRSIPWRKKSEDCTVLDPKLCRGCNTIDFDFLLNMSLFLLWF